MKLIYNFKKKYIFLIICSLLLTSCGTKSIDKENYKNLSIIDQYKQPLFTSQLTILLTRLTSSQRISPLAAARIQAYTYLASYIAYQESNEKQKVTSAIYAAAEIINFLYYNVKPVDTEVEIFKRRYQSNINTIDTEKVNYAVKLVKKLADTDDYIDSYDKGHLAFKKENEDIYSWKATGISQRNFQDPNYGEIVALSPTREICKLPAPDLEIIKKEALELFDNFDIEKSNNEYVTAFLAGVATPTPPGINLQIITNATIANKVPLDLSLRYITASAISMHDSAILAWAEKRKHYLARPETLYFRLTNKEVNLLRETPPHPSYPSGHSAFSGANVSVIENMMNYNSLLSFTLPDDLIVDEETYNFDNTKDYISKVNQSRVDAGFHYPTDVKAGESLGRCVGDYVAKNFDEIIKNIKNK